MNICELKIGNYLDLQGEIVKTIATQADSIDVMLLTGDTVRISSADAKPIALDSEQLLDSCLFDSEGRHVVGIDHHLYYLRLHYGHIILCNRNNVPVIHFWDVRYLHQLQNLYYSLTHKKLEIIFNASLF